MRLPFLFLPPWGVIPGALRAKCYWMGLAQTG